MVNIFKDKKFLRECAIILIVGLIVNTLCFLLPLVVHAESINSVLPYLCQNANSYYNESEVANAINLVNQRYPEDNISDKLIVVSLGYESTWYTYNDFVEVPAYRIYTCERSNNLASVWSSGKNFENFVFNDSSCYIDLAFVGMVSYTVYPSTINDGGFYVSRSYGSGVSYLRLFGSTALHHISNSFYDVDVPGWNYPVYTNMAVTTRDSTQAEGYILAFADTIVNPGDFTDLPGLEDILNNISNSFTPHSNNTPPSYDSNLSYGENISNSIDSLADNINNAINNLGSNIKSWFDNLQQKLTDTTNAILGGIHDGFATLNQNFKDFFGAKLDYIIDKFNYITQEFDSDTVLAALDNTDFKQDFDSLASFHDGLEDLLDIQEPSEYSLVLHLGQINDDFISLAGDQEIDISFLHNSTIFRTFAWCIVVSGLAFIVASGIPSMLRGDKGD